jgi:hypothetical protein
VAASLAAVGFRSVLVHRPGDRAEALGLPGVGRVEAIQVIEARSGEARTDEPRTGQPGRAGGVG